MDEARRCDWREHTHREPTRRDSRGPNGPRTQSCAAARSSSEGGLAVILIHHHHDRAQKAAIAPAGHCCCRRNKRKDPDAALRAIGSPRSRPLRIPPRVSRAARRSNLLGGHWMRRARICAANQERMQRGMAPHRVVVFTPSRIYRFLINMWSACVVAAGTAIKIILHHITGLHTVHTPESPPL